MRTGYIIIARGKNSVVNVEAVMEEGVGGAPVVSDYQKSSGDGRTMAELKRSVRGLEQCCEAERRQAELLQREKDARTEKTKD